MKKYTLILIFFPLLLTMACNGQNNKTYWVTKDVTKADGKLFHGITSSYMDMIASMRIHLIKNSDSLEISYPFEKRMKISEFKSLTNVRIKESGELLDSVYEVKVEGDQLKIKFVYAGTSDAEKKFEVNLVEVDQNKYNEEVAQLKKEREKLLGLVKPVDFSKLDLGIALPSYFKEENLGDAINPIQLADELSDMNSDSGPITEITTDFTFESEIAGKPKQNYDVFAIENTEKINLVVAKVGQVNFNSLELINLAKKENPELVLLTKNVSHDDLQTLYKTISSTMPNAKIETKGLPEFASDKDLIDLDDFISISFIEAQKIVKLSIDVSKEYFAKNALGDVVLAYDEQKPEAMKKVFEHYLNLFEKAKVRLYIVSKSFDEVLKNDENLYRERKSIADYQSQ
ncbi:MAG: hypothetical protein ABIP95_12150 [Pelobium sp.]